MTHMNVLISLGKFEIALENHHFQYVDGLITWAKSPSLSIAFNDWKESIMSTPDEDQSCAAKKRVRNEKAHLAPSMEVLMGHLSIDNCK